MYISQRLERKQTRPDLDRFQDCCKNWSLHPVFVFFGSKNVINFLKLYKKKQVQVKIEIHKPQMAQFS